MEISIPRDWLILSPHASRFWESDIDRSLECTRLPVVSGVAAFIFATGATTAVMVMALCAVLARGILDNRLVADRSIHTLLNASRRFFLVWVLT